MSDNGAGYSEDSVRTADTRTDCIQRTIAGCRPQSRPPSGSPRSDRIEICGKAVAGSRRAVADLPSADQETAGATDKLQCSPLAPWCAASGASPFRTLRLCVSALKRRQMDADYIELRCRR